jgi:hypothetical protein
MCTVLEVGSEHISGVFEETVVIPAVWLMLSEISGSPNVAFGILAKLITAVGIVTAPELSATPNTIIVVDIRASAYLARGFIIQA